MSARAIAPTYLYYTVLTKTDTKDFNSLGALYNSFGIRTVARRRNVGGILMSSPSLSANAVILLAIIRSVRRPAIPANNQHVPAGCPLHRLYELARRVGIDGQEYEHLVRELISSDTTLLCGWSTRHGSDPFGRRLTVIFPELIPSWFKFKSDSYSLGPDGSSYDQSERRAALALVRTQAKRAAVDMQYDFTEVRDLKLHIHADGLPQGVDAAWHAGYGPDGLNHELRRLARMRKDTD